MSSCLVEIPCRRPFPKQNWPKITQSSKKPRKAPKNCYKKTKGVRVIKKLPQSSQSKDNFHQENPGKPKKHKPLEKTRKIHKKPGETLEKPKKARKNPEKTKKNLPQTLPPQPARKSLGHQHAPRYTRLRAGVHVGTSVEPVELPRKYQISTTLTPPPKAPLKKNGAGFGVWGFLGV